MLPAPVKALPDPRVESDITGSGRWAPGTNPSSAEKRLAGVLMDCKRGRVIHRRPADSSKRITESCAEEGFTQPLWQGISQSMFAMGKYSSNNPEAMALCRSSSLAQGRLQGRGDWQYP
jgi:hypothetical protein